jgi:hypothetical protein
MAPLPIEPETSSDTQPRVPSEGVETAARSVEEASRMVRPRRPFGKKDYSPASNLQNILYSGNERLE